MGPLARLERQKIEVAAQRGLVDVPSIEFNISPVRRASLITGAASRGQFLVGNFDVQEARVGVHVDHVAVAHEADRPANGSFGNAGKGSLSGPNFLNWDVGLFKNVPLGSERLRLRFELEFFNLLNRVNLSNPNQTVSSAAFGSIRGAGDPRIGQVALKLLF